MQELKFISEWRIYENEHGADKVRRKIIIICCDVEC